MPANVEEFADPHGVQIVAHELKNDSAASAWETLDVHAIQRLSIRLIADLTETLCISRPVQGVTISMCHNPCRFLRRL